MRFFSHLLASLTVSGTVVQAATLVIQSTSPQGCASKLFSSSYTYNFASYAGLVDRQFGLFSNGNNANFGIDSGIVLSSGGLTTPDDSLNQPGDSSIPNSFDAASFVASVQAKPDSPATLATFGAVFCTCEDLKQGADQKFVERAQILINDQLVYNKTKGPEDTRPTTPFGFAVGDKVGNQGGPCKCSGVEQFNLVRPVSPVKIKVVIADIADTAYNSWIFLGFLSNTVLEQTTSFSPTITSTASTETQTSSVTMTTTTTSTAISTTSTTLVPLTVTSSDTALTTTATNTGCTTYVLHCEQAPVPNTLTTTTTTFVPSTSFVTATETTTLSFTDTSTIIESTTTTATVTPTASTSHVPASTATVCKLVDVPKFFCPRGIKIPALVLAAEKTFLDLYNAKRDPKWPSVEVQCDGDSQSYVYP